MEKKIQYSFGLLSMMLFLAITTVSAKKDNPNNLYSVLYIGDTNVTVGKPFWIQCLSEAPIEWHKDNQPIQQLHFIRHSKEDYRYSQHDDVSENSRIIKSTIKVKHALMSHSGKYKCNMKHEKSHALHVNDAKTTIVELDNENGSIEDEYDESIAKRVSFEPMTIVDDALKSTMMMFVEEVSESSQIFSPNFEDSYEQQMSGRYLEMDEFEVTTSVPVTSTHAPIHKHNKHKVHEPFIPHEVHNPHEMPFDTHAIQDTQKNHVLPTIASTTEQTTTILNAPKHQHKGKLEAVYEDGKQNKLFVVTKSLILECTAPDTTKIIWMKDDVNVNDVPSLQHRFKILPKEGRFIIDKTINDDAGNYTCSLDNESQKFDVWAQVIIKVPDNIYVVEHDKLEIICDVRAGTQAVLSWFYSNTSNSADANEILLDHDRIKLETVGPHNIAKLIIEKVELSDRGTYYCRGTNEMMQLLGKEPDEDEGLVRIKGKLAALWPFLGICAEVFILCAIILIYESRRNKTDLDESDTDQSPDQKNDNIKDDVRQRK